MCNQCTTRDLWGEQRSLILITYESRMELLTGIAHEGGRSVVMVTHNLDAATATDRIITLTDGRIGSDVYADRAPP